ncbi:uncharacterized protein LOC114539806 [Dendronephthya gigantea]|uniref:uncharacterized protein LOC114539806 n=1 Tax=Dendronephthya gigantea TaxID=151771 RepID=UPI00106B464E|nr:uncharacterized protein LOC114539806 [Dendronephthya gigantea]
MDMLLDLLTLLVFTFSGSALAEAPTGQYEGSAISGLGDDRLISYQNKEKRIEFEFVINRRRTKAKCKKIDLPQHGIEFKGKTHKFVFVCPNGLMRFKNRGKRYQSNPRNFGTFGRQDNENCLAPYWSVVDLDFFLDKTSNVTYDVFEDKDKFSGLFNEVSDYGEKILGKSKYRTLWAMVFTWRDLSPPQPGTFCGKNTFQVLLANSIDNEAIAVFIYKDIDWSVKANKTDYPNFQGTGSDGSDLPVVGWNSRKREANVVGFENFARSGTVNVEEVDDFEHERLKERGKIGMSLFESKPLTKAYYCEQWVNEQLHSGRGRVDCTASIPCAPTYKKAKDAIKNGICREYTFSSNTCITGGCGLPIGTDLVDCCYKNSGRRRLIKNARRGAGRSISYTAWVAWNTPDNETNAFKNCCSTENYDKKSCNLFHSVRPICGSDGWKDIRDWAYMFGDPHFVTLDGKNYTFNGCGWYTYFTGAIPGTSGSSLVVQVRTTRVEDINATVFTGVAIKEGNSEVVQVNLVKTGALHVRVNRERVYLQENSTGFVSGVFLSHSNKTLSISTPLGSGLRIRKAANNTLLTIVAAFLPSYKNSSLGLIGKWNDILEDDFTLPNGTVLPIDMSESEIFHKFGEKWRVPQNETIYQVIDDNDENYVCPDNFVAIFSEEALASIDEDLKREAESVCGNDVTCLFDIAATKQVALGVSTLTESDGARNEIKIAVNNAPVFTQNITEIIVTLNATFQLDLNATDPDGDNLTFDVPDIPEGASFIQSGNRLFFTWHVMSPDEVIVTFLVTDSNGAAVSLSPNIRLCRCVAGGLCTIPEATSQETADIDVAFLVMTCECPDGRTGEFCEVELDYCAGELTPPCHPLVSCFNHPTNFTCGDCPTGYVGDGSLCLDIDECGSNTDGCDQTCGNTVGSYFCECGPGYSLNQDKRSCDDIDECSQPNDCSQLCGNTLGSYNCSCKIGFKIDPDNPTECEAQTECSSGHGCNQICYIDVLQPGVQKCACRAGFSLGGDPQTCNDINECVTTETNLCDQLCFNTEGSYTCSCIPGYRKAGQSCTDIDECFEGTFNCTGFEECENLPGSYRCLCPKRLNMIRVNGTCEFREEDTKVDIAPEPPSASSNQTNNAIEITVAKLRREHYTVDVNTLFKDSVVTLVNDFCNENRLRPQDCGVEQNKVFFSSLNVERLPGYPQNVGEFNTTIKFYVDYPTTIKSGSLPKAILASIVFSELAKFEKLFNYSITLDTPVTPEAPRDPSDEQRNNAVTLEILDFTTVKWTTFYDTVFRRSVAIILSRYCRDDSYSREKDCEFTGSDESFESSHVGRIPGFPRDDGGKVLVSFYVTNPSKSAPVPKQTLASMLVTQGGELENALSQKIQLTTTAFPEDPPPASDAQRDNSVVIRISSISKAQWTYLIDRRLRRSIANRTAVYCGKTPQDCEITGGSSDAAFNETNVQRTSSSTPSDVASVDYSFYVNYPSKTGVPLAQHILASVVKNELDPMQAESALFFSLQTPFGPPNPPLASPEQSANAVTIKMLNQRAAEWSSIDDTRFRISIAKHVADYCSKNPVVCGLTSGSVSFNFSHVTRNASSPEPDGDNSTYTLFVNYPSGNGPIQLNFLAGILTEELRNIESETSLKLQVETSTLAPSPPSASQEQLSNAVTMNVSNTKADEWSAIQDNRFRGYIAKAIADFCTESEAKTQECTLPGGDASFTLPNVQRAPGYPTQNGTSAEIKFYVNYPGGGVMSEEILRIIVGDKLDFIKTNSKLDITLIKKPIIEEGTLTPPTRENEDNAVSVVLKNFTVEKWPDRDVRFLRKMAEGIQEFCNTSSYHLKLCNISQDDLKNFTSKNIRRLPGSPEQDGPNSILKFYATLPGGKGTVPKSVLATVFVEQQNNIFSVDSELQNQEQSIGAEQRVLSPAQKRNNVTLSLKIQFKKFTSLAVMDLKVTVAERMTVYCFSTAENTCNITISESLSRKKRDVRNNKFTEDDVDVITNSVAADGTDTKVSIVVNEPGTTTPISSAVVEDGLHRSFSLDDTSTISSLTLQLASDNVPVVSPEQKNQAITVRLLNTQVDKWQDYETSFRENMSSAISQFCGKDNLRLDLCQLKSDEIAGIKLDIVKILPDSPVQNGTDLILSFFVELPSGTMPLDLLTTIFSCPSKNILSRANMIVQKMISNPTLSEEERKNLIPLSIGSNTTQNVRLDVKVSIAHELREYCSNDSEAKLCPKSRNFTKEDIRVFIHINNSTVNFVAINNDTGSAVQSRLIRGAIGGKFESQLCKIPLSIDPIVISPDDEEEEEGEKWPIILGGSLGGVLLIIFVVFSIILCVTNWKNNQAKYKTGGGERWESTLSRYSSGGWQFDRDSPYHGSSYPSVEAIPGFDEDGLPVDVMDTENQQTTL